MVAPAHDESKFDKIDKRNNCKQLIATAGIKTILWFVMIPLRVLFTEEENQNGRTGSSYFFPFPPLSPIPELKRLLVGYFPEFLNTSDNLWVNIHC